MKVQISSCTFCVNLQDFFIFIIIWYMIQNRTQRGTQMRLKHHYGTLCALSGWQQQFYNHKQQERLSTTGSRWAEHSALQVCECYQDKTGQPDNCWPGSKERAGLHIQCWTAHAALLKLVVSLACPFWTYADNVNISFSSPPFIANNMVRGGHIII